MSMDINADKNEIRTGFNINPDNNNLTIQFITNSQQLQQNEIATPPNHNQFQRKSEMIQYTMTQSNHPKKISPDVCLHLVIDSTTHLSRDNNTYKILSQTFPTLNYN